jgi:hypothetical protein
MQEVIQSSYEFYRLYKQPEKTLATSKMIEFSSSPILDTSESSVSEPTAI